MVNHVFGSILEGIGKFGCLPILRIQDQERGAKMESLQEKLTSQSCKARNQTRIETKSSNYSRKKKNACGRPRGGPTPLERQLIGPASTWTCTT